MTASLRAVPEAVREGVEAVDKPRGRREPAARRAPVVELDEAGVADARAAPRDQLRRPAEVAEVGRTKRRERTAERVAADHAALDRADAALLFDPGEQLRA